MRVVHGRDVPVPSASADRRHQSRQTSVPGALPGPLLRWDQKVVNPSWATDVSEKGMGLLVGETLAVGAYCYLLCDGGRVKLKVAYCHRDGLHESLFRVGVVACEGERNLEQVFAEAGCVPKKAAG